MQTGEAPGKPLRFHLVSWTHCLACRCIFFYLVSLVVQRHNTPSNDNNVLCHGRGVAIISEQPKAKHCSVVFTAKTAPAGQTSERIDFARYFTSGKEAMCCASSPRLSTPLDSASPPLQIRNSHWKKKISHTHTHAHTTACLFSASSSCMFATECDSSAMMSCVAASNRFWALMQGETNKKNLL